MTREMDAKIAEWMGWTKLFWGNGERWYGDFASWRDLDNVKVVRMMQQVPSYSTSRDAMSKAEDVVRERGLDYEFGNELALVMFNEDGPWTIDGLGAFRLTHATAEQRARALCRVIEGQEE